MKTYGKKYRQKAELVTKDQYALVDAVALVTQLGTAKFDETVEIHMRLGVDVRQADQMVRSSVSLPEGTGKQVRVVAFVPDNLAKACLDAGAIRAGHAEFIDEVAKGFIDFDVAIATPDVMKDLGKVARILGPKGLMPNPKTGTVSADAVSAVKESLGGRIEFRADKFGIVHNGVGKVSFGTDRLMKNVQTYVQAILAAKPQSIKGTYVKSITLTTTMGPSVPVDPRSLA